MLWGHNQVHVFTDHRNILFVCSQLALRPNAPRYVVSKAHRWAINLSGFDYSIEQTEGVNNVFADLLTRWAKGHKQNHTTSNNVMAHYKTIVPPARHSPWPNVEALSQSQVDLNDSVGQLDEDGFWNRRGRIVIPEDSSMLKFRIMVTTHCGTATHSGAGATETSILNEFIWGSLTQDVK